MPKVSVIVTSHNYGKFLDECLTSIRAQSYKDYELIVVDDGSTDDTSTVASKYSPDKLLQWPVCMGTVWANNRAISESSGSLICLVNADDFIEPPYLEKCVEAIGDDPQIGIAYTDFWHFGNGLDNGVIFQEYTLEALKNWNFILGSAMFRREAYTAVGGFDPLMSDGMEDYDLWLSICENGWHAKHVPGHYYHYRSHDANQRSSKANIPLLSCKLWRKHGMLERMEQFKEEVKVTATISTKGRYQTTLPLAITAVAMQTRPPNEFILFDDNDSPRDLRQESVYEHALRMLDQRGVSWKIIYGGKRGQVFNHQLALDMAAHPWIWRLDDDNVPDATVLEKLISSVALDVAAVGGLIVDPRHVRSLPSLASNRIEDIYAGMNIQWYWQDKALKQVDHLYSSFLFRKQVAKDIGGYDMNLSPAGHREETSFTYKMRRAGWTLLVNTDATTWHFQASQGGIRTFTQREYWEHDEAVFTKHLQEWGVVTRKPKIIVLNSGLGDHLMFLNLIEEIKEKYKNDKLVLAVCYPEVFEGQGIPLISIAEAELVLGQNEVTNQNLYKYCWDRNWKRPIIDAYREMYL